MLEFENHCPLRGFPFRHRNPPKSCFRICLWTPAHPHFPESPLCEISTLQKVFFPSLKGFWLVSEVIPPSEQLLHILPLDGFFSGLPQHFYLLASPLHHTPAFGASASNCYLLELVCPSLIFIYSSPRRHPPFKAPSGLFILCVLLSRVFPFTSYGTTCLLSCSFSCTCSLTLTGLASLESSGMCLICLWIPQWDLPSVSYWELLENGQLFLLHLARNLCFSDLTPHSGSIYLSHPLLSSLSTQPPLPLLLEEAVLPLLLLFEGLFFVCLLLIPSCLRSYSWWPASLHPGWLLTFISLKPPQGSQLSLRDSVSL